MRITKASVAKLALPQGQTEAVFCDDQVPGFGLRVRAGGSRTWQFRYAIGHKQWRISIGRYPALPLEKARSIAADHHAAVRLGRDPAGEKEEGRASASETFDSAAKQFLEFKNEKLKPLRSCKRHSPRAFPSRSVALNRERPLPGFFLAASCGRLPSTAANAIGPIEFRGTPFSPEHQWLIKFAWTLPSQFAR
jgi:Arm DNA-binding domain